MEITLKTLLDSKEALERLVAEKLPVRTSYNLGKFVKAANQELETFNSFRTKLLDKYGIKQDDGTYKIESQDIETFNAAITDLLDTEVHFDFEPISLEALGNSLMSSQDMMVLDYLIKE